MKSLTLLDQSIYVGPVNHELVLFQCGDMRSLFMPCKSSKRLPAVEARQEAGAFSQIQANRIWTKAGSMDLRNENTCRIDWTCSLNIFELPSMMFSQTPSEPVFKPTPYCPHPCNASHLAWRSCHKHCVLKSAVCDGKLLKCVDCRTTNFNLRSH